jgi:hypothetical protein
MGTGTEHPPTCPPNARRCRFQKKYVLICIKVVIQSLTVLLVMHAHTRLVSYPRNDPLDPPLPRPVPAYYPYP